MDEGNPRYAGWRVVGAASLGVFFASAPLQVFAVFLKPLCEEFGWSREEASTAFGVLALVAALSAPGVGKAIDRFGVARIVGPSAALSALTVLSFSALSASLTHLYIAFGLLGLFTMGASPIAHTRAIFSWFERRRGRAVGLMLAGAAAAGIVLPPVMQLVIESIGWRVAWLALGGLSLALAFPVVRRFVNEGPLTSRGSHQGPAGMAAREAISTRMFWTLVTVVFVSTLALNGVIVHLSALLTDRGVAAGDAALVMSVMGAANFCGRIATGLLLDRFSAIRVSFVLLCCAAAGTLLLASASSVPSGIIAAALIGAGMGGEMDITPYLLSRYFGLRSMSTLYGLNWTAWGFGGLVGPILLGRTFDATGSYAGALLACAAGTTLVALLVLTLPPVARRSEVQVGAAG